MDVEINIDPAVVRIEGKIKRGVANGCDVLENRLRNEAVVNNFIAVSVGVEGVGSVTMYVRVNEIEFANEACHISWS